MASLSPCRLLVKELEDSFRIEKESPQLTEVAGEAISLLEEVGMGKSSHVFFELGSRFNLVNRQIWISSSRRHSCRLSSEDAGDTVRILKSGKRFLVGAFLLDGVDVAEYSHCIPLRELAGATVQVFSGGNCKRSPGYWYPPFYIVDGLIVLYGERKRSSTATRFSILPVEIGIHVSPLRYCTRKRRPTTSRA